MGERWRLLDTGASSGAFNMALDEALVAEMAANGGPPLLRFYGWTPPAISFGYGQRPDREVDLARCRRLGVDLVRRPTGGRAVLHWEELTYSVICCQDHPRLGGSISETYRVIGECLREGLRRFGVETALERVSGRPLRPRGRERTAPCFSSIARWEVNCRGRKLIGSAQRRMDGVILQHGSLLIGEGHRRILDLLPQLEEEEREEWRRRLAAQSIELRACCDREIDVAELSRCMIAGFEHGLAADMQLGEPTPAEAARAQELIEIRYGNSSWIYGRSAVEAAAPLALES